VQAAHQTSPLLSALCSSPLFRSSTSRRESYLTTCSHYPPPLRPVHSCTSSFPLIPSIRCFRSRFPSLLQHLHPIALADIPSRDLAHTLTLTNPMTRLTRINITHSPVLFAASELHSMQCLPRKAAAAAVPPPSFGTSSICKLAAACAERRGVKGSYKAQHGDEDEEGRVLRAVIVRTGPDAALQQQRHAEKERSRGAERQHRWRQSARSCVRRDAQIATVVERQGSLVSGPPLREQQASLALTWPEARQPSG
jgi:hypothetical protein